jgi:hypothetical protein
MQEKREEDRRLEEAAALAEAEASVLDDLDPHIEA